MSIIQRLHDKISDHVSGGREQAAAPSYNFDNGEYPQELLIDFEGDARLPLFDPVAYRSGEKSRYVGTVALPQGAAPDLSFMHEPARELPQYPEPTVVSSTTLYQSSHAPQPDHLRGS